jgi:hypothetical protein
MNIQRLLAVTCLLAPLMATAATLDIYGQLLGKTILAPSALPGLPDSIVSELPPDKTNAIAFLESEFSKQGISVVHDGPTFVRLFPNGQWQAGLSNAPLRGAQLRVSPSQERMPPSVVTFATAELTQVLDIYAAVKNRTILQPRSLPPTMVRLNTQSALTQGELVYAVETVLALNGIATVDDGQSFVQVVPIQARPQVSAHAPAPEPGTKLFDPTKVPTMGHSDPPRVQTKLERDLERWRRAFFEFIGSNGARNSSAQRLLELYANLSDKEAEPSKNYETTPIWFHVTTPLSKSELLYAIETTFALNNLAITRAEDGKVQLVPSSRPGMNVGKRASPEPKL